MEKVSIVNVMEAVKKQLPAKPIDVEKDDNVISAANCPRCRYSFPDIGGMWESAGEIEQYDYCPNCGQRLDWQGVVI